MSWLYFVASGCLGGLVGIVGGYSRGWSAGFSDGHKAASPAKAQEYLRRNGVSPSEGVYENHQHRADVPCTMACYSRLSFGDPKDYR